MYLALLFRLQVLWQVGVEGAPSPGAMSLVLLAALHGQSHHLVYK